MKTGQFISLIISGIILIFIAARRNNQLEEIGRLQKIHEANKIRKLMAEKQTYSFLQGSMWKGFETFGNEKIFVNLKFEGNYKGKRYLFVENDQNKSCVIEQEFDWSNFKVPNNEYSRYYSITPLFLKINESSDCPYYSELYSTFKKITIHHSNMSFYLQLENYTRIEEIAISSNSNDKKSKKVDLKKVKKYQKIIDQLNNSFRPSTRSNPPRFDVSMEDNTVKIITYSTNVREIGKLGFDKEGYYFMPEFWYHDNSRLTGTFKGMRFLNEAGDLRKGNLQLLQVPGTGYAVNWAH